MAKIDPTEITPAMRKELRGRVLIRVTPWGTIASKWPRKKPTRREAWRLYHELEFGKAARLSTSSVAEQLDSAILQTKGSGNVARDLLTAAAMGTVMQVTLADGTRLYPARMVNPNPQYILDLITDLPGSWLMRNSQGWVRSPAPQGLPMTTTLRRSTDAATVSATAHTLVFQDAPIDDNGTWDSVNPSRIYIPATATRVKIDWSARMSQNSGTRNWSILLTKPDGTGDIDFTASIRGERNSSPLLPYALHGSTGWCPNPGHEYMTLVWNWNAATTVGYLGGSIVTMQCYY
jgi:hypothetical protein